jgi:type I restriction enzyme S subunit
MSIKPLPAEAEIGCTPGSHRRDVFPDRRNTRVWGLDSLPSHWQEKPLKRVARINVDKLGDTTDPDYEIEYVDIGNVTLEQGITSTERFRFEAAPSRARRLVREGDTIVSTVRTYLKAVAKITNRPENLVVSTGFAVLRAGRELDSGYLYRLAQSEAFVERVVAHSVGVSYPAINATDIGGFTIPIPPLDEQRAIAAFLDRETAKIDELIAKKRRLIELLQIKRKALIGRTLTKGLDANAPMKPSGVSWLGSIPKHWNVKRVGFMTTSQGGCTPSKENVAFWNGRIPWVTPKDMKVDVISDSIDHVTDEALQNTGLKLLPDPLVLIVVRGMILAHTFPVTLTKAPVTINQDMKALTPNKNLDAEFLSWLLRACSPAFFAIVEESGHGTRVLRTDLWSKQELPIPPLDEQRLIATHVKRITEQHDSLDLKVQKAIDKLLAYRAGLINAAVTGQIDVRNYRPEAPCQ